MPRKKKFIENIEMMQEEDIKVVEEFIASDPQIAKKVEALKNTFRKHFCFGEEEINLYIYNICRDLEYKTLDEMNALYEAFARNDVDSFDHNDRCTLARGIVDDSIALFMSESKRLSDEFIEVLEEAKKLNIDPFKLAIKTNMRTATVDKFKSSVEALTKVRYLDINTDEQNELFSDKELKEVVEQCASLACNASAEAIQKILNLLNGLFYDKESKSYVYNVKEIIMSAPSILTASPEKMEIAIEMLQLFDGLEPMELLDRIKASPSILTVDFQKIFKFSENMSSLIKGMIANKKPSELTSEQRKPNYADTLSNNFAFNINHLTQIEKIKLEDMQKLSGILSKYLGFDNSITCLQNMTVLNTNPDFLEFFLASLVQEEAVSKTNLRQIFVESPYRALTNIDLSETVNTRSKPSDPEYSKGKKESIVVKDFPNVFVSEGELNDIKKRVGGRKLGLTKELLAKMKEFEEKRKVQEAERLRQEAEEKKRIELADAERRQRRNDERRRKKEEARAKRKASRYASNTSSQQVQPVAETPQISLEELQALRRAKVKPLKDFEEGEINDFNVFRKLYSPIVDALREQGLYLNNLPKFNKLADGYEALLHCIDKRIITHDRIMELSHILHELTFDDEKVCKKDIIKTLSNMTVDGRPAIQVVTELAETISNQCKWNDSGLVRAIRNICQSDSKGMFTKLPDENDNFFGQNEDIQNCLKQYAEALTNSAEKYFGEEYKDLFFSGNRAKQLKDFNEYYFSQIINPQAFNSLEVSLYISDYIEVILQYLLTNKIIIRKNVPTRNEVQQLVLDNSRCNFYKLPVSNVEEVCRANNIIKPLSYDKKDIRLEINKDIGISFAYRINNEEETLITIDKDEVDFSGFPALVYFQKELDYYTFQAENPNEDE